MSLERIVRPFQLQTVTPPRHTETAYQVDAQPIKLVIGKNGSGKTLGGSSNYSASFYMDAKLKETAPF